MKLKQFINEASDNIADINLIKKYFEVTGEITPTDQGLTVDGSLHIKERVYLDEVPVKIYSVTQNFDVAASNLKSLKNFPSTVFTINISGNPEITSLVTDEPITCQVFNASETGITTLDNVKINVQTLFLRECEHLQKILGSSGQIKKIDVSGCPQLQEDPAAIPGIQVIRINPYIAKNVPLVRMILSDAISVKVEENLVDKNLEKIINEYRSKGPGEILNLIRALRDAGYKGNARL